MCRTICVCLVFMASPFAMQGQPYYTISSIAGTNEVGDGGAAVDGQLAAVEGLAVDVSGNLYIADNTDHRVRKVDTQGIITTIVGDGNPGLSGDGGPAASARLKNPYGVAVDATGTVFVADYGNARIRRIAPDGTISSLATTIPLLGPRNVAVDTAGNVYVADHLAHVVVRINPAGRADVVAGSGQAGFNGDGAALTIKLNYPAGLAFDAQGSLYIADSGNKMVRRLTAGLITTVAGGANSLPLYGPTGVDIDAAGNLLIADSLISRVICRAPDGKFTVVAGANPALAGPTRDVVSVPGSLFIADGKRVLRMDGSSPPQVYAGNGSHNVPQDGAATRGYLAGPMGIALGLDGDLYIAEERTAWIRRVTASGFMETVVAGGSLNGVGDGGPALFANLTDPVALAIHPAGGLRIADHLGHRIRGLEIIGGNITVASRARTIAGSGYGGFSGDTGSATAAEINRPRGMAFDAAGNLYFADSGNHRVRKIALDGTIRTVAPDVGFRSPLGVAVGPNGDLYVADSGNNAIRKVDATGVVTVVDGLADLNAPAAVALDLEGNLYVADTFHHRILRRDVTGKTQVIAGTGVPGFSGDGGYSHLAQLRAPSSLAIDPAGNVYIADVENNRVRKLSPTSAPPPAPEPQPPPPAPAPPPAPPQQTQQITVVNAASYSEAPLAPGELISIFGSDFGDSPSVKIDGIAAPILHAGKQQINAQVPYAVDGKVQVPVEVFHGSESRGAASVAVVDASPALFTLGQGSGEVLAVHLDGSVNTAENAAGRGSIVTLYATGAGTTTPGVIEGVPVGIPLPSQTLPVSVQIGTGEVELLYAGPAPGMSGVMQINLRLPGIFTPPGKRPIVLKVGSRTSRGGVFITVR